MNSLTRQAWEAGVAALVVMSFCGRPAAYGQEVVTALDRTAEFDMRSAGGTADAGIRTLMIQVFTP